MKARYQYRIYPTSQQAKKLAQVFGCVRVVYNDALAMGNKLFLAKMGLFKVQWSRLLPSEPSSVTIIKNTAGQYHVSFVVEIE